MMSKDLILSHHLARQLDFSIRTFGPEKRTMGLINHIKKELVEIELTDGNDIYEWVDLIILACDGALRSGFKPQDISDALDAKQTINENRKWPNWRDFKEFEPIEHVRDDHE